MSRFAYAQGLSKSPGACIILEVLLYCPYLRFDDDGIEPPIMKDVVPTPITMNILAHEPFVVVLKLPLVVPKSIFDFDEENVDEHDDIAQSLGSMGIREETKESINNCIQVILSTSLTHHSVFFANALYVCLNKPFT